MMKELQSFFQVLSIPGIIVTPRVSKIHGKPIVQSASGRCELGDLLVVIKYHRPDGLIEAKSIIYQIKLSRNNSSICDIDKTQLSLLTDWPTFSFGGSSYNISPLSLEFGSYMLEPRNPPCGSCLPTKYRCYGICTDAVLVRSLGPNSVNISSQVYARGDANNFFSHLVFEIGENHINKGVNDFVEALYRYVGLSPDPPDEFIGYSVNLEDDGFGIFELNVRTD
ncbi:MAG: hypothetical protein ABIJ04_05580 [Bacteroidota bacterium]